MNCPLCNSNLEQDFGIVNCSKCGALLMIEMDGSVHNMQPSQRANLPHPPLESTPAISYEISQDSPLVDATGTPLIDSLEPNSEEESSEVHSLGSDLGSSDFSELSPVDQKKTPETFEDVVLFGNEFGNDAGFSFTLTIEGIDYPDIRKNLHEALSDSKFNWNEDELVKSIKNGKLILSRLNSAKMNVLMRRLKDLPLKLNWVQNILVIIVLFVLLVLSSSPSLGSESTHGGGGGESSHGSEKKQAGGKKEGDLPEWVEIQNQISNIQARIISTEGNIEKLLEQKSTLKNNSVELKKVIDELVKQHSDLRRLVDEYEKKNAILKFRFPERGEAIRTERTYEKQEVKSLEEMEAQFGIQGRIKRTFSRMKNQYGDGVDTQKNEHKKQEEKPLEKAGSIILRK